MPTIISHLSPYFFFSFFSLSIFSHSFSFFILIRFFSFNFSFFSLSFPLFSMGCPSLRQDIS